ncbi:MAG: serpin family protein [Clostridium sp.]|nr:serpin family protein [Bacteroides sp.]MCM1377671.1 serpin family protein [Prevotella sp.]MCM1428202.1 serpin family protein [Clostridium sp.]MCM1475933.1 serpin family protein [Muribaculaceae bacterium]
MKMRVQNNMKLYARMVMAALMTIIVSACSSSDAPEFTQKDPIVPDVPMKAWLNTQQETGMKVMRQLCVDSEEGNIVYSPLGMYITLSMTANASPENLTNELLGIMNYSDVDQVNTYNKEILETLPYEDPQTTFLMANSVWVEDYLTVNPMFQQMMSEYYNTEVKQEKFTGGDFPGKVNKWVEDHTNGIIREHLDPTSAIQYFCFTNALYFKSPWSKPFKKELTKKETFRLHDGTSASVQMMQDESKTTYYWESNETKVIVLPFGNGKFEATFILPPEGDNVRDFIRNNSIYSLADLAHQNSCDIRVYIPTFEVTTSLNLVKTFRKLGAESFLHSTSWPKLASNEDKICATSICQSVSLKIDEDGGEATVASTVHGGVTAIVASKEFRANRPFIYMISEKSCNLPLFIGTYERP